ncbi:hypothetical protein [Saccharibacillus alkalitolerans]|uniref:Uncharacterized protein n=1 Tax=Saccharibacillus alkalitolerans TaxID=2705290 RepID=A0ABX0F5X6_9BACL|nr:hypothetical protein [Saccharibacillus alkalitolerans]NGZ74561.1 hypothetical protein [Saccharibacillus alkalitolerans]
MKKPQTEIRTAFELELLRKAQNLRPGPPPPPWNPAVTVPAAGAYACGWDEQERLLLLGGSGFSLILPETGEVLMRERDVRRMEAGLSRDGLTFTPPQGGSPCGLFGFEAGGGIRLTSDGWSLEVIYPWWPRASVVLDQVFAPGHTYLEQACLLENDRLDGPLLCGFSPSGRHLAILGSGGAVLHSRQT